MILIGNGSWVNNSTNEYFHGEVRTIISETQRTIANTAYPVQVVKIRSLREDNQPFEVIIPHGETINLRPDQLLAVGDSVVFQKLASDNDEYLIIDHYRLPQLRIIVGLAIFLVLIICGIQGLGAIAGLLVTGVVLLRFIIPSAVSGESMFLSITLGTIVMIVVSMILAHGIGKDTWLGIGSIAITLLITLTVSAVVLPALRLSGLGSEEAYALTLQESVQINFRGLLLAGIILGTAGVLDDIVMSQLAIVRSLRDANAKYTNRKLFLASFSVGRTHVLSLVNTLVLAYAGAALPLFLLLLLNPTGQPTWVILNSEFITEEIIRTLLGSAGLMLAVPIATAAGVMNRS